jgi:hypothetical protein
MQIPILVEPISANGFRASTGAPLHLHADAANRAEALQALRELIDRRVAAGAELVELTVGAAAHPLAKFAGCFKDDPLLQEWKDAMREYRDQVNADGDDS